MQSRQTAVVGLGSGFATGAAAMLAARVASATNMVVKDMALSRLVILERWYLF
jgi:hypothetical protein